VWQRSNSKGSALIGAILDVLPALLSTDNWMTSSLLKGKNPAKQLAGFF
jgi:hypothetical protein